MATRPNPEPARVSQFSDQEKIDSLLLLNEAARKIGSILDLEVLVNKIVHDVAAMFGCNEACVWLRDGQNDEMVLQGIVGCRSSEPGDRLAIGLQGMVGHVAATGRTRYAPDVTLDPFYISCEPETRSELDIPLICDGEVVGVFSANSPDVDGFTSQQRHFLQKLAVHVASAIKNARAFTRDRSEREEARRIQQALFPRSSPLVPEFQIDGYSLTHGEVGGDWYDYFRLQDGRIAVVIADVAGKGMPAALLMSSTRGMLRSYAASSSTVHPGDALTRLNRILLEDLPSEKFITMILGVLDPAARTFTFANAGHPAPIVADQTATLVEAASGLPLGIADRAYEQHELSLPAGSRLLLYSDGISEASNNSREEYGYERLCRAAEMPALNLDAIFSDVNAFAGGRSLSDDATVVLLQSR